MNARLAVLGVCLVAAAVPAVAQVHRWVDERGVVQYGDRPPATGAVALRVRSESATAPAARTPAAEAAAAPAAAASAAKHGAGPVAAPVVGAAAAPGAPKR